MHDALSITGQSSGPQTWAHTWRHRKSRMRTPGTLKEVRVKPERESEWQATECSRRNETGESTTQHTDMASREWDNNEEWEKFQIKWRKEIPEKQPPRTLSISYSLLRTSSFFTKILRVVWITSMTAIQRPHYLAFITSWLYLFRKFKCISARKYFIGSM